MRNIGLHFLGMWLLLAMTPSSFAADVAVHTVDQNGAPFAGVLVIVKSLDGDGEIGRHLTDQNGVVAPLRLGSGLYRLIATCPYGACRTMAQEFFGSAVGHDLTLRLRDAAGTKTRIQVLDPSGAPVPGVLVIIALQGDKAEIGRYLSGTDGTVAPVRLGAGMYKITATCPYGICETVTREVLGPFDSADLKLQVPLKGTGKGELVGAPRVSFEVQASGQPPSKTTLLIRDTEASLESWYPVPPDGKVDATLVSDPAVVVLVRGRCLRTFEVASQCPGPQSLAPGVSGCLLLGHGSIRLQAPACE